MARSHTLVKPFAIFIFLPVILLLCGCNARKQAELEGLIEENKALQIELKARESKISKREVDSTKLSERLHELKTDLNAREKRIDEEEQTISGIETDLTERDAALREKEEMIGTELTRLTHERRKLQMGSPPKIYGKRALVMDADTGDIFYEKSADTRCAVASTQKILTALIIIESGGIDGKLTIEKTDVNVEPTKIGVKVGETYTRRALVKALLVRSGNDIAHALARDHAGSVDAFASVMNERAKRLGMEHSHFKNPHGLTETGQLSTASDMAKLARVAYANPIVREFVKIRSYDFIFNDGRKRLLSNTNKVLRSYAPCNGMKTGYTRASGNCLISSAKKGERNIICVVLGSSGSSACARDSKSLLEWGMKAK